MITPPSTCHGSFLLIHPAKAGTSCPQHDKGFENGNNHTLALPFAGKGVAPPLPWSYRIRRVKAADPDLGFVLAAAIVSLAGRTFSRATLQP